MLKSVDLLKSLISFIQQHEFLLISEFASLGFKLLLLFTLIFQVRKSTNLKKPLILISAFLAISLLNNAELILKILFYNILNVEPEIRYITFIARLNRLLYLARYYTLYSFLKYLVNKKIKINFTDYIFYCLSSIIFVFQFYLLIFKFNSPSSNPQTIFFEKTLFQITNIFLIPLFVPILIKTYKQIQNKQLPKILSQQVKIFINLLIIPHLILEVIIDKNSPFVFLTNFIPINKLGLYSLSTILISYAMYYCTKKILGLRFLNVKKHVEVKHKFNFINDFKNVLEQLSQITALKELSHVTQTFFKAALSVPLGSTKFYIRKKILKENLNNQNNNINPEVTNITNKVENFIAKSNEDINIDLKGYINKYKIFIRDEVEFSNFYDKTLERETVLKFLNDINADIFLPIFEKQIISGYIIVEQNARPYKFYNNVERDEMLVYSSYLSNIINILKHGNLNSLLKQQKELSEELYSKHQEANQYKESIRYFLRMHQQRKFGVITYKGRTFTMLNQEAQELTGCYDINVQEDKPITQALKKLVKQVRQYQSNQTCFSYDSKGNKLVISAVPSIETKMIIVMLYYPDVSDIVKSKFDTLKDPSKWDYLLYLETTKSGKLINDLIPGNSETLLNFKISLLSTALSKKATLIQVPQEDLISTVELIHHISLKENLQVLKLNTPEKNNEVAIKLFGINPILDTENNQEALLYLLDSIGTLFIENIHFLSLETQNKLASYIAYGYYNQLKSDQKIFSNVRIVCSCDKNISQLVAEGKFSKALFNELERAYIKMPTIGTLPEEEISELAQGFTDQTLKTQTFKNLLELSDKEKNKLIDQNPVSIKEVKNRVKQLLLEKSTKNNITENIELTPELDISDPEVLKAIKLGKKALKDSNIMSILWNKFKNQNKIATILGVNRSSVNRRCKEYNLN